jgi:hypothetical protein
MLLKAQGLRVGRSVALVVRSMLDQGAAQVNW